MMTNEEKKKEAKRRYSDGYSISEIALTLDINENTLRSWKRRGEWKLSASSKTVQKTKERKTTKKELKKALQDESGNLIENIFLTSKQKLFCAYYVTCFNATQAYQKAYGCSRKTAGAAGYNLLKKIEVQKAIEELQQQKMVSAMGISSSNRIVKTVDIASTEGNAAPNKTSIGAVAVGTLKNIPRPDQNGTHRGVFERNKKKIYATQSVCGICGRPVDFSLRYPHPLSACIDHIIPVAKGGHPSDIENLQLAHWTCNRTKSDKLLNNKGTPTGEAEIINNRVLPQSVDWRTF